MNSLDVKILQSIVELDSLKKNDPTMGNPPLESIYDYMLREIIENMLRIQISLVNLERLGILRLARFGNQYEKWDSTTYVTITEFGGEFLLKCKGLS
jgi:hypothetical protein